MFLRYRGVCGVVWVVVVAVLRDGVLGSVFWVCRFLGIGFVGGFRGWLVMIRLVMFGRCDGAAVGGVEWGVWWWGRVCVLLNSLWGRGLGTMPRAVTLIRSDSLSDVVEYAYAATAPAESRLIFLAGACPLNEDGSTAALGDYAGQARKAVENMQAVLAALVRRFGMSSVPGSSSLRLGGRTWWLPGRWSGIRSLIMTFPVP